jgi:hypothetical protein
LSVALTPAGQESHVDPFQELVHEHVQPVSNVPLTRFAWPLQLAPMVHLSVQSG